MKRIKFDWIETNPGKRWEGSALYMDPQEKSLPFVLAWIDYRVLSGGCDPRPGDIDFYRACVGTCYLPVSETLEGAKHAVEELLNKKIKEQGVTE